MLMVLKNRFQQFGFDGQPLDFNEPRAWAALTVRPAKEQAAADRLREYQLFSYWPCYLRHMNIGNGRRRPIFSPVIPGYIFIAVREGTNVNPWHVITVTPGIIGYLRDCHGAPAYLGNDDIEVIRMIESGLNLPPPPDPPKHNFKTGDKVRFLDAIYTNWPVGRIKAIARNDRISVEVPLLGQVVTIEVYPHQIEKM